MISVDIIQSPPLFDASVFDYSLDIIKELPHFYGSNLTFRSMPRYASLC